MLRFYCFVLFLFQINSLILNAQKLRLSGYVFDQEKKPLEFVNIVLYNHIDSQIVSSKMTINDGSFRFRVDSGVYFIKAHMIGYNLYKSEGFSINKNFRKAITLIENVKNIETVEVVAQKPFLEQQAGKLVVNVADNITGLNGSLKDVLKKVPGTMVIKGNVSVGGDQNVRILINGANTDYMDMRSLLNDFPAEDIEKIEVITEADASMDASGGTVLNIIIKKNKLKGTNGNISLSAGQGVLPKYGTGLMLNHRNKKLNVFGSARFSHNSYYEEMVTDRMVLGSNFLQHTYEPSLPYAVRLYSGLDYNINEKQNFTISVLSYQGTNEKIDSGITLIQDSMLITTLFNSSNIYRYKERLNVKASYDWRIDSNGHDLKINARLGRYNRKSTTNITSYFADSVSLFLPIRNEEPGITNVGVAKIDYTVPVNSKLKIQSGLKWSHANIDNNFQSSYAINDVFILDTINSNHYIFKEDILAVYSQFSLDFTKIQLKAGLRYEESSSLGYSKTINQENSRRIKKIFPSVSINLPLAKKIGLAMAYSQRIRRPRYSSLNPFKYYYDPYTYRAGNPNLMPQYTDKAKLSITYSKQPFFNLEYARTNNVMLFVTEQNDSTAVAFGIHRNLDLYEKIGGSLFLPLKFIKKLNGYGGIMLFEEKYSSEYLDDKFERSAISSMLFLQANYNLSKLVAVELSGWYSGGGFQGIMYSEPIYGVSIGFELLMLNKQLVLDFSVDDIFAKNWIGQIQYSNMDVEIISSWERPTINMNLKYKFGNKYLKKRKRQDSDEEELKRANEKL